MGLFDDVMGYFGREGAAVQARIVTPPSQVAPTPRPTVDPMSGRQLITTAERGGITYTREQMREPSFRARRKLEAVTRRATRRVKTGIEAAKERITPIAERVKAVDIRAGERIPSIAELQRAGAEFRREYPRVAHGLYESLGLGAAIAERVVPEPVGKAVGFGAVGAYKYVEKRPLEVAGYAAMGAITPAAIGLAGRGVIAVAPKLPMGARAISVARKIPRWVPEAGMVGLWGEAERRHIVAPVVTDEFIRPPTREEMAERAGEAFIRGAAFVAGARIPSAVRDIRVSVKALPEEKIVSRVPGMISEVRPSLRAMMAEEKAVATLIPKKVQLARHKELEKYIRWEKEAGKLHKERVFEIREELGFKRKYHKELEHKIRTEEKLKKVRRLKPIETAQELATKRMAEIKKQIEKGELREVVQPGQYKTLVTGERVYVPGTVQLLKIKPELRVPKVKEKPLIEVEIFKPVEIAVAKVEPPRVKVKTVKEIVVPKVEVREKVKIGVVVPTLVKEVVGVSVFPLVKPKVKVKERIAPPMYVPVEVTPTVIKERERVVVSPFYTPAVITPTAIKTVTPLAIETVTPTVIKTVTPTAITQIFADPLRPIIPIPLLKLEKEEKVRVAKKRRAMKGFEWFIDNPIASPFGNSVGKVK